MIDTEELHKVMRDSLYKEEEIAEPHTPPQGAVVVEGLTMNFAFHPERLESHRAQIRDWLCQLPVQFRRENGGGWSTLNAVMLHPIEDGVQWGEQMDMQELLCLGIGLGLAKWQLPRDYWSVLPGGMPYVELNL